MLVHSLCQNDEALTFETQKYTVLIQFLAFHETFMEGNLLPKRTA